MGIRSSIQILSDRLDQYTTTIEYDEDFLLSHSNLNRRTILALKYRIEEKKILRTSIGHLRAMWQFILETGEIPSPADLLNIKPNPSKRESFIIPSGYKLDIPEDAIITENPWEELYFISSISNSDYHTIPNDSKTTTSSCKDCVIERANYIPIIANNGNELIPYTKNYNGYTENGLLKVAILVASKVDTEVQNAFELPIIKILLKSILNTFTKEEQRKYFLTIYIGFDYGDKFYDSEKNMASLHQAFNKLSNLYPIQFRTICTGDTHGAPARAWSRLGNIAYHEG